jgi:hypothetical protein
MASVVAYDVCDINLIYQDEGYQYYLPRSVLEGFLSGKAFDNPDHYTEAELHALREDIRKIFADMLSTCPEKLL